MSKIISALAIKPPPSISQRDGINIKMYGYVPLDSTPGVEEEKEIDIDNPGRITIVTDVRKARDVNCEQIIRNLTSRRIIPVGIKKLPSQSVILEESELDSAIQSSDSVQEIQFERPQKDVEKRKKGKKGEKMVTSKPGKTKPSDESKEKEEEDEEVDEEVDELDEEVDELDEDEDEEIKDKLGDDEDLDIFQFEKRMPSEVVAHRLKTSTFYMNNRKKFLSQLMPLFSKYKRELSNEEKKASCDDTNSKKGEAREFKLMTHQKVVSDYLNLYTPYRGLLLYHGLGSGKTCTSIAIAEGMKSQKQVIVMTLASLKANFYDQMKVCGDPVYKLDQFWEFISTDGQPNYIQILSKILKLPEEYVSKNKGAWMVNVKKDSNFNDLSDVDKKSLNQQIDMMIRSKYKHYNYNGLNLGIMNEMTDNLKKNPFDNCVVVIDEVHNFVSRIVNKLNDKTSISYKLYEYLMSATNARIVLLSGTPIINYPNEIGILFNILRGYIKTWTFPFTVGEKGRSYTRESILSWFKGAGKNRYDYVELSGQQLIITRNPFGFVNKYDESKSSSRQTLKKGGKVKKAKRGTKSKRPASTLSKIDNIITKDKNGLISINNPISGSQLDETDSERIERIDTVMAVQHGGGVFEDYTGVELDDTGNTSDLIFKKEVIDILGKHHLRVENVAKVKLTNNKALPDISKEFLEMFVELGAKDMKNERLFQRRILGLTSYFRGADEKLYPSFVPSEYDKTFHIEHVPMSAYQFGIYEKIRAEESKREKQNKKRQAKQDMTKEAANLFKIPSTYRIASRMCCNFSFPDPPGRPQKGEGEKGGIDEMGEEDFEEDNIGVKRGRKATKMKGGENSDSESDDDKEVEEEEEEDVEEEDVEEEEEDVEEEESTPKVDLKDATDIVLEDVEVLDDSSPKVEASEEKEEEEEEEIEEIKPVEQEKKIDYPRRMMMALNELKGRADEIFSVNGLKMYSPKFLKILENIQNKDNTGLHLLYSQFRTMEGIGIFKLILETNGYAELKIQRNNGEWELFEEPEDKGKPKFALHTGTETDEEKKIILNIYNSKWEEVPSGIVSTLRKQDHENNFMGEVVRILMITASGAEGINLKNTRFVHIVEPYWNMVRLEQVIGRARRICSHQDLPPDMRTVKVFLYISVLSEEHSKDDKHIELRHRDQSKLTSKSAIESANSTLLERYVRQLQSKPAVNTTDQQLFENALIKDHVNSQILHAVKETAMDCKLYEQQNKSENLVCFNFGTVSTNAFASQPAITQDAASKDVEETQTVKSGIITYPYNGVKYALNERTGELFDLTEMKELLKRTDADINELTAVGKKTTKDKRVNVELFDM